MFDKMLEVGAAFDWISPLLSFAGDLMHGPGHTFLVAGGHGDPVKLLRSKGVQVWGEMALEGQLHFRVREKQARWAQYQLETAGFPITGGAVDPAPMGAKGEKSAPGSEGRLRK